MANRAIFLDRDGTLIQQVPYLHRADDLKVYPQSFEALSKINESGKLAVVVTNQSAIARGLLKEPELREIHDALAELCRGQGVRIDAFYYCPHHPSEGTGHYRQECDCRKPQPGLLLRAARDLGIDLRASHMIGDQLRDVEAGHRAGCTTVLVKTGYGKEALPPLNGRPQANFESAAPSPGPDHVAEDVLQAVKWSLEPRFEG